VPIQSRIDLTKSVARLFKAFVVGAALVSLIGADAARAVVVKTTLYRFRGVQDGASPLGPLVIDRSGALYGVTFQGGKFGMGTVFKLAPPVAPSTSWTKTTLHDFAGAPTDGRGPMAGLVMHRGALYGSTFYGGVANVTGTVFRVLPPRDGGDWRYEILHKFDADIDGWCPDARLAIDANGIVYGFTMGGGTDNGGGTLFKLTPSRTLPWPHEVLYNFSSQHNGGIEINYSAGVPLLDSDGSILTTSFSGGLFGGGTVFKFVPGATEPTILYSFDETNFGAIRPDNGVVVGSNGILFGTTYIGGNDDVGAVFSLSPPVAPSTTWTQTRIYDFPPGVQNNPSGTRPTGVVLGGRGDLFGATTYGGTKGFGDVFKLAPPAVGQTAWTPTVLHSFRGAVDGAHPGNLLRRGHILYGVTSGGGGACDCGTVFKIEY
jgi:uncharacterized repeat protein (TIGR03803 family)